MSDENLEFKCFKLDKKHKDLPPEDFLYDRRGPWPQPSPNHPFGEVAGVLHIPFSEWINWWHKIGSRYVLDLIFWSPIGFLKALKIGSLKPITDEMFSHLYLKTCYAKYICTEISQDNAQLFKDYIEEEKTYYIIDFSGMDVVKPTKGLVCEKTITLLEFSDGNIKPIAINMRDYVCDPKDEDLWLLGKFLTMVAASVHINVCEHPKLHFPMDAINAITKTALPKTHVLNKLLLPHLEMTLKLDYQVLNSPMSLLQNKWWMIFSPFGQTMESLRDLMVIGYCGIKGNPAYPKYEYPINGPKSVVGDFGLYHKAYYKDFYEFAKNIKAYIEPNDYMVTNWANYIHQEVESFPDGCQIWRDDNFEKAIGVLLWDLTVGHAVDHKTYSEIPIEFNPIRFRCASPRTKDKEFKFNIKKASNVIDITKWLIANRLFYKPWNVTNLTDVEYNFNNDKLNNIVKEYRASLYKTQNEMKCTNFMSVDEMPSSIQY